MLRKRKRFCCTMNEADVRLDLARGSEEGCSRFIETIARQGGSCFE